MVTYNITGNISPERWLMVICHFISPFCFVFVQLAQRVSAYTVPGTLDGVAGWVRNCEEELLLTVWRREALRDLVWDGPE